MSFSFRKRRGRWRKAIQQQRKEHEVKHPMPWTIEDLSDSRYDSAGEEYIEPHFMVRDTNSHLVVELHDRRVAARIVALTKVAVEAQTYILTGCQTGLKDALAELEALQ
jgi:hypothetical protein